ncbi:MAG: porin family protein [Rickettsiales bacterium]|jgi:opacity protein-like surface antigen|nr:porin family protein [Rickettsiales bacterium]
MLKRLVFILFFTTKLFARTILLFPEDVQPEQLNKDVTPKLQTLEKNSVNSYTDLPNQYKGGLKYTEPEQITKFRDYRFTFGVGMYLYDNIPSIEIKNASGVEHWNFGSNFGYDISVGVYWVNGVKIEYEYGSLSKDILGKSFLLDLKKNILNLTLEQTYLKDKMRPYIGFGIGSYSFSFGGENILSNGNKTKTRNVAGIQLTVGLAYPFSERIVVYIGYKGFFTQKVKQKIYDVEQEYEFSQNILESKIRFKF